MSGLPESRLNEAYKNADDMPISDILTEIRQLVSNETTKRYSRDRELAVSELLILRPEARVDLAISDAVTHPADKAAVKQKTNVVQKTLGLSSREERRDVILEVIREEFN